MTKSEIKLVRIQKLLADWGIASRRAIEELIAKGRITADGEKVQPGFLVDPSKPQKICIDGTAVKKLTKGESSIYLLHKPAGVLTTLKDEFDRKTIKTFLPRGKRLYPVGRLDYDSTGLLLITDNGELTNRLLHPSFKVEKEYLVRIHGATLSRTERNDFKTGLEIEGKKTAPCQLRQLTDPQNYIVIIKEGRKRQVRRMFEKLGRKVVSLHRTRIGPIHLGRVKPGEIRALTTQEKAALLKQVGLGPDKKSTASDKLSGKPVAKPVGKTSDKGSGKQASKPAGKPVSKPAGRPFGKPAGKPAGKPFGKPASKPAGKPFGKPAGKSSGKGSGKTLVKPSVKPSVKK